MILISFENEFKQLFLTRPYCVVKLFKKNPVRFVQKSNNDKA